MDEFFDFDGASVRPQDGSGLDVSSAPICLDQWEADLDALQAELGDMSGLGQLPDGDMPSLYEPPTKCDACVGAGLECFLFDGHGSCSGCESLGRECNLNLASTTASTTATTTATTTSTTSPSMDIQTQETSPMQIQTPEPCRRQKQSEESNAFFDSLRISAAEKRGKKSHPRFSKESVRVLKNWLDVHSVHPYPNDDEKNQLKRDTGLKRSQISNWLANARRRGKVRPPTARSTSPSLARPMDIPSTSASTSWENMHPMDRWQHSPPEHEPASVSDIANAIAQSEPRAGDSHAQSSSSSSWTTNRHHPSSTGSSFSQSQYRAPSMSSLETLRSSNSDFSFGSAFSNHSLSSMDAMKRKDERKRRRRRRSTQSLTAQTQESSAVRMFQCTFCTARFKTKHDWQRHEKSFHLSLEKWTCAPAGGIVNYTPSGGGSGGMLDGTPRCAFCNLHSPSPEHLETAHNFSTCHDKSLAERTFYRKDHLRQHLRLTHNAVFDVSMEDWKAATTQVRSRCGFCGEEFTGWQARVDHLAAHFRSGAEMSNWQGHWGFEPGIHGLLENAVLPQQQPPPSSQSRPSSKLSTSWAGSGSGSGSGFGFARPPPFRPFQRLVDPPDDGDGSAYHGKCAIDLEIALSAWTQDRIARGAPPSDAELQERSRWIIYMSPDTWNATAADDEEWLKKFKRNNGLSPVQEDVLAEERATYV